MPRPNCRLKVDPRAAWCYVRLDAHHPTAVSERLVVGGPHVLSRIEAVVAIGLKSTRRARQL